MILFFQLALFLLVAVSFIMVVGVPVAFASPDGWTSSKGFITGGSAIWFILVITVGVLNSFVV